MKKQSAGQNLLYIALIAAFAFLAMSSSLYNGLTSGNDFRQHFQFAQTIHDSIISGELYPSFAAAPNNGYGDIGLRFYPPLASYVLSLLFFIVGNLYWASLITFTLIFFVGGTGVYFWAREEFSDAQSLLAAAIYIFAPYHLNQIYNNFLFAEFTASAIVPFCFLYISRLCRTGRIQDVLGLSISYALLILTNLPLTVIGSIALSIYALTLLERHSVFRILPKLIISVALALAASSFYWLRMATELNWVNVTAQNNYSGIFDYRENFLFAPQNILNFINDSSVLWLADLMLLAILLISIPSMIVLFKERKKLSQFTKAVSVIFFTAVFLTTPLSKFVWDNFPLLQKVQFPWRWLGIVSVCGSVFASIGIFRAADVMKHSKNLLIPIGLGVIFFVFVTVSAFITKDAVFLSQKEFNEQTANIANAESFNCWWTVWAKPEALQINEKIVGGERNYEILKWKPLEREINIAAGNPVSMRVATFYYPHWQAVVNGQQVSIEPASDGAILIPISEVESKVQIGFQEPYFIKIASLISVLVWLVFAFGEVYILTRKVLHGLNSLKRSN